MNWALPYLLLTAVPVAWALTCLQCKGVSQPRHCNIVDKCYPGEVCGVEKLINTLGHTVYNVGCIHQSKCHNSTDSIDDECTECCYSDICNSQGCGTLGYPQTRGPICHYCPFHTSIDTCNEITFCEEGDVCRYSVFKEFGDTIYTSECSNKHVCQNDINHGNAIVGRDVKDSSTIGQEHNSQKLRSLTKHVCSGCCDGDLCFKGCNSTEVSTSNHCSSSPCHHGQCENIPNGFRCVCDYSYTGYTCDGRVATDCFDIFTNAIGTKSGVYNVTLWRSNKTIEVYCDMETFPLAWTVLQHRFDGSVDFYRNFSEYVNGFGNMDGEFWLGLRYIEEMTSQYPSELRIDVTAANGSHGFEIFQNFSLSEYPKFTLHVGNQTAGQIAQVNSQGFVYNDGQDFSTYDHDVDSSSTRNCGKQRHGGWWYNECSYANLNGEYGKPPGSISSLDGGLGGFIYNSWLNTYTYTLKASKMMFRKQFL